MQLSLTPAEAAFQNDVQAFLDAELTPALRAAGRRCAGIFTEYPAAQQWHRILAQRGWSVPHWPVEHGGTGWSPMQHYLFASALAAADAPPRAPMGPGMVAPVIMAFGTPEQKARWLSRMRDGLDYWCQGYSEPGAGSDLAALRCQAVREGGDYVLNGTKIWTTHAQYANMIFCLVRTRREGKAQQGISFLCLPMDLPGITVRPIHSISGDHELNQVFFDDVRVPASGLIGEENQGWTIAKYLLQHERGGAWAPALRARWRRLVQALDAAFPAGAGHVHEQAALRLKLADAHSRIDALQAREHVALRARARGEAPGGIAPSAGKILGTELRQFLTELHVEIAALGAIARPSLADAEAHDLPVPEDSVFAMSSYLNDRAASIYAGTNEVQRNLVSAQLLRSGLPPGPPLDETETALCESLSRWLAQHVDLAQHARIDNADGPSAQPPVWQGLARDLDLLGAGLSDDTGGLRTQLLVLQTLGARLAGEPYLSTALLAGRLLQGLGVAPDLLARIARGEAVVAWAHAEPGARGLDDAVHCSVQDQGGALRLTGHKIAVQAAPWATHALVTARTTAGLGLLLLDLRQAHPAERLVRALDGGWVAQWQFDALPVSRESLLCEGAAAEAALDRALNEATLGLCAESLGVMRTLLDDCLAHVRTREQFGTPLASQQVLQHRVADMYLAFEQAQALTWACVDAPGADALAVSSAKAVVNAALRTVGQGAVQLHGAMGLTEELAVGRFFRRATQIECLLGSRTQHLLRMQRLLWPAATASKEIAP